MRTRAVQYATATDLSEQRLGTRDCELVMVMLEGVLTIAGFRRPGNTKYKVHVHM